MNVPRSVTQLMTWLKAVGIPARSAGNTDLLVQNSEGREVVVTVVVDGVQAAQGSLIVNGADLTGRDLKLGFEAFAALQQALGFEAKMPVDRGAIPMHKLANGADFELAAFRHTEFRRSPNQEKETFKKYDATVTRACWKFYRSNMTLCGDNMLAVDDLKTFAQVWMTNFCGLYELKLEEDPRNQNERLLYTYIEQRFNEFRKLLSTKGRNELPSLDTAFIGQQGRPYDYMNRASWDSQETDEDEDDEAAQFIDMNTVEGRKVFNGRRAVAAQELDSAFSAMGHDKLVEVLTDAAESNRIHPDARDEAKRRLETHKETCTAGCNPELAPPAPAATLGGSFVDETGRIFQSPGEAARVIGGIHRQHVRAILRGEMDSFQGHTFCYVGSLPVKVGQPVGGAHAARAAE